MEKQIEQPYMTMKAIGHNMKCRDFQYEIGKTYEIPQDQRISVCSKGFHAIKKDLPPTALFKYYSPAEYGKPSHYCKVAIDGEMDEYYGKVVGRKISILGEMDIVQLCEAQRNWLRNLPQDINSRKMKDVLFGCGTYIDDDTTFENKVISINDNALGSSFSIAEKYGPGVAAAGAYSYSHVGVLGTAIAGANSVAIANDSGTAVAGDRSIVKVGHYGSAVAGAESIVEGANNGIAVGGSNSFVKAGEGASALAGEAGFASVEANGVALSGSYGRAMAGVFGSAIAGMHGMASAGNFGKAMVSDEGLAAAGDYGIALSSNDSCSQVGDYGVAMSKGKIILGKHSIGIARGTNPCAKAGKDSMFILIQTDDDNIDMQKIYHCYVDGKTVKANTWYGIVDNMLTEISEPDIIENEK